MWRCAKVCLWLSICLALCCPLLAQRRGQTVPNVTDIHIYVRYPDERPVGDQIQVELVNEGGVPILQGFTNSEGQAVISIGGGGSYRVRVSGPGIETTTSERLSIDEHDRSAVMFVTVQSKGGPAQTTPRSPETVTSASQLRIPPMARKPFDKGMDAMQRKEFPKAADLFQKAIDAYPQYDAAYDNLGVALMQMGESEKAGAAFQKAVELNDKNADANRNYARFLISTKKYDQAIEPIKRALMVTPQDSSSLTLLAIAEFQTKEYDAALQTALKIHQSEHEGYAVAHYIAGKVYEMKNQASAATAEYETYLQESPNGPQAEQVRAALARLTGSAAPPAAAQ